MEATRPLPEITELTEPYWSALRAHRLIVQRCVGCGTLRFPPEVGCASCGSRESAWVDVSGRATLWSYTICHPPLLPFFAEQAPWPVVVVQLEEGPRMVANIAGVTAEDYTIGMPLQVSFEDVADDVTLLAFRPTST